MTTQGQQTTPVDFSQIVGVGGKTAAALAEAGIGSMAELAELSVGQVAAALEGVGVSIPAGKIISQRWLLQAWLIAEQPGRADEDESGGAGGSGRGAESMDPLEELSQPEDGSGQGTNDTAWEEQFGLFIYLDRSVDGSRWRTRIWDTTEMEEEKQLAGVTPGVVVDLIIDRVGSFAGG